MYEEYFQLKATPFSIAPDPAFLYMSSAHREALAHLMYGFSHGGFVLITGEVGTGKTTLLRNLLKATPPDLDVAFVLNPRLTVRELLETLCDELGVVYDRAATSTVKQYIDALNAHLLQTHRSGRSTVLIIDEAQNLSPAVLEQIRLLTNLETDERKLLRIILLGQPELAELLARNELRQLAQRITARYHLGSLSRHDTYAYVMHRLSRAGGNPNLFTPAALRRLYRLSKGTPRIVNVIADRALLGAYSEGRRQVTASVVRRAAQEVLGRSGSRNRWLVGSAAAMGLAGAAWAILSPQDGFRVPAADHTPELAATPNPDQSTIPLPPEPTHAVPEGADAAPASAPAVASPPATSPTDANNQAAASVAAGDQLITPESYPLASDQTEISNTTVSRPGGGAFTVQRQAYSALFARWGVDFDSASTSTIPCDFAPSAGLQCLSQRGDWGDINRLNLPVVMELWDASPTPYHAALTGLEDGNVTLNIANRMVFTTMRELRAAWSGAYVVLWQTPPGYRGSIREGDTHETVGWLRQQLATLSALPLSSSEPNHFDQALAQAVVTFQQSEGLLTDGIVGPATWIRLADRLELPQPDLTDPSV